MSQNEKYDEFVVGVCHDAALLTEIWEAFRKLFGDYVDEVIEALTPIAEALSVPLLFGIDEPCLSAEELEDLFKQAEKNAITFTGTSPKKYGMSLRKHPHKATIHYNYIPRTPKNLPYQRRAF